MHISIFILANLRLLGKFAKKSFLAFTYLILEIHYEAYKTLKTYNASTDSI